MQQPLFFSNFLVHFSALFAAIESLKLGSMQCSASPTAQPVTAEFIPLKKDCNHPEDESARKKEKDIKDANLGPLDLQLCTVDNTNSSTVHSFEQQQEAKVTTKVPESVDLTEFDTLDTN